MLEFTKRILFVDRAVAREHLPILLKHVRSPSQRHDLDFDPNGALKPWVEGGRGVRQDHISPRKTGRRPEQFLSAGDLSIDLAWNIDCGEIVQWCHDRGVLYINTSVELWIHTHPRIIIPSSGRSTGGT